MFLNIYLFLLNIVSITFVDIYLKKIYLSNKEQELIKNNLSEYKNKKKEVKMTYKEQLAYMKLKSDCWDIEIDRMLYWKPILLVVAVFSALTIVITEPISIFGIKFRYMSLLLIIITIYVFTKLLRKIGIET
jgi:hypothetical protein